MSAVEGTLKGVYEKRELAWRRALYGGLFAGLGATVGWLLWIALQVGVSVLLAPLIGAVLELLLKWFEYHKHVAASESSQDETASIETPEAQLKTTEVEPKTPDDSEPAARRLLIRSSIKRAALFSLPILLAILLGVAADLIKAVFIAYLQSVATIFPVGAFFALYFHKDFFQPDSLAARVGLGVIGGMIATAIALAVFYAMGGREAAANVYSGWWVLAGICFALAHVEQAGDRVSAILAPSASMLILLLLLLILIVFNLDRFAVGVLKTIPATINSVLSGPDLPATSWKSVKIKEEEKREQQPGAAEASGPLWNWLARSFGCNTMPLNIRREDILYGCDDVGATTLYTCVVPECFNLNADCPPNELLKPTPKKLPGSPFEIQGSTGNIERQNPQDKLAICARRYGACEQAIKFLQTRLQNPAPGIKLTPAETLLVTRAETEELRTTPHIYRKRQLCKQLQLGWGSALVRSLLAIILFSVFWGYGRSLELSYRPRDYARSRTRKLDIAVLVVLLSLIITIIIISRSKYAPPSSEGTQPQKSAGSEN